MTQAHLAWPKPHLGWRRTHAAWGGYIPPPPAPIDVYQTLHGGYRWIATCNNWPGITSQATGGGTATAGKLPFSGDKSQRIRNMIYHAPAVGVIPSGIISAEFLFSVDGRNTLLESFYYLQVRLRPEGPDPTLAASYQPLAGIVIGALPDSDLVGACTMPLDPFILNAYAGSPLMLMLSTYIEEIGAGRDPSVPTDLNSYLTLSSTLRVIHFVLQP